MERHRCSAAGAAVIGAVLLLGVGVWWLVALEKDRREFWEGEDAAEVEEREQVALARQEPPVSAEQDREAISERLSAELGCRPCIVSVRTEPLWNLAKQGVKVVRVSYQRGPGQQPAEGCFLLARGKVRRL